MLRLGLTGGIGAGKSTVARRLAERGALIVDADRLAREVVEPGTAGLAEVVAAFGERILAPDGSLDRPALGRVVFGDAAALARLNAILHPRIAVLTAERTAAAGPDTIVVHDVPLLVENGMGPAYQLVIVVDAPVADRVRRLVADRGMSEADARARIAAQAGEAARRAAADVWLDNSGSPQALVAQVDRLWDARLLPFAENLRRRRAAVRSGDQDAGSPDAAQLARAAARLARAAGKAADVVTQDAGLQVTVRDPADAAAVRGRLEAAGFVPLPPDPGATGADGEVLLGSADPGLPLLVHVA